MMTKYNTFEKKKSTRLCGQAKKEYTVKDQK